MAMRDAILSVDALRRHLPFAGASDAQLVELAKMFEPMLMQAGEMMFDDRKKETPCSALYIVMRGRVALIGHMDEDPFLELGIADAYGALRARHRRCIRCP